MSDNEITSRFLVLETRQATVNEQLAKVVGDHEKRIRWLERTCFVALGVVAVLRFFIDKA